MCCCQYDSNGEKYYFALSYEEKIKKDEEELEKCDRLINKLLYSYDKNYIEKLNRIYDKKRELEKRIAFNKAFGDIGKMFR